MPGPKPRKASYGSAEKSKKLSADEKSLVRARVVVNSYEAAQESGGPCKIEHKEYLKMKELIKKSQEKDPIFSSSKKTGCSFGSPTKKPDNVGSPSPSRGVRFNENVNKSRCTNEFEEDWDGEWFTPMESKERKAKSPSQNCHEGDEDVAVAVARSLSSAIVPANPWPLIVILVLLGVSHFFQWIGIAVLFFKDFK